MDLTACQPTWVMLCRNEICQTPWKKFVKNIPTVDPNLKIVTFKVCIGDLSGSDVLIKISCIS